MTENTKIQWCDHTFNPWRGCVEVSPACDFCYAAALAKRNPKILGVWGDEEDGGTRVMAAPDYWKLPLKWNEKAKAAGERHRVFCASLADVFEDWQGVIHTHKGGIADHGPHGTGASRVPPRVTMGWLRIMLFNLISETPNLDWLLLTKRPENILKMFPTFQGRKHFENVWLGTTAENTEQAHKRTAELSKCRELAPVLFLSCEPLLEAITGLDLSRIDWVISGDESGPHARFMPRDYHRNLLSQCQDAGVAFFEKQICVNGKPIPFEDFPEDLQVREFPDLKRQTASGENNPN